MLVRARAATAWLRDLPVELFGLASILLVAGAFLVGSPSAPAAQSTPKARAAAALPTQGVYDECAPTPNLATCVEHLQRLAGAGLPVVLNYTSWFATPQDLIAYADAAAAAGVKVIWPLNDATWRNGGNLLKRYPKLAAQCGCTDLLAWVVGALKGHPATWGWYIGDELPASEAPAVQALAARVRELDPTHPLIYVAMGLQGQVGGEITPFAGAAEFLGTDIYPVGTTISNSVTSGVMAAAARQVQPTGASMVAVLQAFAHDQYPTDNIPSSHFPTAAEMTDQRDQAIQYSDPKLILWYSLYDIDRSSDPAGNWAALVAAAHAPAPGVAKLETTTSAPAPTTTTTTAAQRKAAARAKAARAKAARARAKARAVAARR
jgi:hypothetical protein